MLRENDDTGENNCISILNRGEFRSHLYIVMDLLKCDLYQFLCKNDLKGLPNQQVKFIAS